jgi:hypothetical protein
MSGEKLMSVEHFQTAAVADSGQGSCAGEDAPVVSLFFLRLYRRTLAAGGILALAWWVMGATPLWNVATAPRLTNSAPQFTVTRFRKGDRLPMTTTPAVRHDLRMPQSLQREKKLPLGCDPVLGPSASPAAKLIYGRCVA